MLDIKNLERRWLKYKVKSFLPYITVAILSLTLLIGISIWLGSTKAETKPIVQQKIVSPALNITKPTISTTEDNTTFIEPSMEFVQSFQNTQPLSEVSNPTAVGIKKSTQQPTNTALTTPKTITMPEYSPAPTVVVPTVSKTNNNNNINQSLSIKRDEAKLDINTLERRFKETSNANLGLFIARYYYARGDYNDAYNYALKTNDTNDKIDESWIIFSKSLVKLGKTDQAKKTLQLYISQSNSENAKALLEMIENGNFK